MIRKYKMPFNTKGYAETIKIPQYDTGYDVVLDFTGFPEGTTTLNGYTAVVEGTRADGLAYAFQGTVSGTQVSFPIDTTCTGCPGNGEARVRFLLSGEEIAAHKFIVQIEKSPVPDDAVDADVTEARSIAEQVQEIVDTAAEATAASAQQIVDDLQDELSTVKEDLTSMQTATASDVGKALKAKTVTDGKVVEWEFGGAGGGGSGQDGFSPTVTVTNITGGHRVSITDVNGTKTFDVMDGTDGDDGFSPTVTVTTITGGHRVSITDATGTKSFDVMDGVDSGGGTSVTIDKTLTVEDAAADAKAVGDRINGLFTEKATDNLFNKDVATVGSYVNPYTGDVVEYDGVFRELIEFEEGSYTFLAQPGVFGANAYTVAMFDENGNFVSYTQGTHTEIDSMSSIVTVTFSSQATATAKYFNINGTTDILNTLMVVKGTQYPSEYVPYGTYKTIEGLQISKSQIIDLDDETNPLKGKIISLNGDSIAAGTGYQGGYGKIIAEENSMTYENIAVGGGTVAYVGANVHCISRTIGNMRADADYVILDGGGNDADSGVPLGTLSTGYDATLDDTTFAGAFESMLKSAIARFPNKKIGYVFIHKCAYLFSSSVENSYYGIAKAACEKWGIPYCDLNTQTPPLNYIANLKTNYTANGDGYHPNEQGYKLFYVPKITAWIKTL